MSDSMGGLRQAPGLLFFSVLTYKMGALSTTTEVGTLGDWAGFQPSIYPGALVGRASQWLLVMSCASLHSRWYPNLAQAAKPVISSP